GDHRATRESGALLPVAQTVTSMALSKKPQLARERRERTQKAQRGKAATNAVARRLQFVQNRFEGPTKHFAQRVPRATCSGGSHDGQFTVNPSAGGKQS